MIHTYIASLSADSRLVLKEYNSKINCLRSWVQTKSQDIYFPQPKEEEQQWKICVSDVLPYMPFSGKVKIQFSGIIPRLHVAMVETQSGEAMRGGNMEECKMGIVLSLRSHA